MELKLRKKEDVYIIDVSGEMDLYNANQLKELFGKMIDRDIRKYIVNMQGVSYIDSSGIGTLISLYSSAKEKRFSFFLANVQGTAKKVMELTKLLGFFPIAKDIDDALAQMP
jgi:anti-sigma B factor antagonist